MISPGDNIVIIGDSWGCGEWSDSLPSRVVHTGLAHFLSEYGCNVVHLASGGAANCIQIRWHLMNYLKDNNNIDSIIWFQTDPIRDLRPFNSETFPQSIAEMIETGKTLLEENYEDLNNIGIKVYCLGGVAKLEESIKNYPNLVPVIPSIIEMFGGVQPEHWPGEWIDTVRLSDEFLAELEATQSNFEWRNILPDQWFEPDGAHPNRDAHYKIFQHIINQHK